MDPLALLPDDDPFVAALDAAIAEIEALPGPFGEQLATVAVVIEEEPTRDQLASVHAPGLLGLYQGVPRTAYGADLVASPSKITLFRGPLMRTHRSPDMLREGVAATLIHELGHHLGISDARIDELQEERRRRDRAGSGR
jgi:predicted Zn-dependent protease with MMP-like domain